MKQYFEITHDKKKKITAKDLKSALWYYLSNYGYNIKVKELTQPHAHSIASLERGHRK